MKTLLITTMLTITFNVQAVCHLELSKKKMSAKTAYLSSGDKITKTYIKKLAKVCKITYKVMNRDQVKRMKIEALQKRLLKLKGQ